MDDFCSPYILRQQFAVYGSFFRMCVAGRTLCCRSTLEIILRNRVPDGVNGLMTSKPDHVVFMMNPGSSYPCDDRNCAGPVLAPGEVLTRAMLRPAYPDKVQYQIMRVMVRLCLQHVRVLNLSDVRESRSARFFSLLCNGDAPVPSHSILSTERTQEFKERLNPTSASIVVGWGESDKILPLATVCVNKLDSLGRCFRLVGMKNDTHRAKFTYPCPPFKSRHWLLEWVSEIASGIADTAANS